MTSSRQSTDTELLGEVLAQGVGEAGDEHLELDLLSAYLRQALPLEREAEVNDHLMACSDCREELLALRAFEADDGPAEGADSEIRKVSAWRAIRKEIRKKKAQRGILPIWRGFMVAAAVVPLLVLSMGFYRLATENRELREVAADVQSVRSENRELRVLAADAQSVRSENRDLIERLESLRWESFDGVPLDNVVYPYRFRSEIVRSAGTNQPAVTRITVPEEGGSVLFRIDLPIGGPLYTSFVVELLGQTGVRYGRRSLKASEAGQLKVVYPIYSLLDSEYELQLSGVSNDGETTPLVLPNTRFRIVLDSPDDGAEKK